jgi:hypothetical protein
VVSKGLILICGGEQCNQPYSPGVANLVLAYRDARARKNETAAESPRRPIFRQRRRLGRDRALQPQLALRSEGEIFQSNKLVAVALPVEESLARILGGGLELRSRQRVRLRDRVLRIAQSGKIGAE